MKNLKTLAGVAFAMGAMVYHMGSYAASTESERGANYIIANAETGLDWPSHGLDYSEKRFSPLSQINADNVKDLKLEWSYDLEAKRGVEATPIVVGGKMYVTSTWGRVHAIDAKTGDRLWVYDPEVPRSKSFKACCDVVNRGVAYYEGKVIVGTLDGRLVAIDADKGTRVWEVNTFVESDFAYTITGAPRVYKGKVLIGNGGADFGARGYVSAYDVDTGKLEWRWFTVPGDPEQPYENREMEKAAKTWDPSGEYWKSGGGGTVWDSIVFDPELDLVYIGTGNGSPWSLNKRSPGGGDNLYLNSIVALNLSDGSYRWHYQEMPGESWDYTATQDMILADIRHEGELRKVLLHAPKNGFFYVVDRETGEFISAENYVFVNWAHGYDNNGRPILNEEFIRTKESFELIPGTSGAHNWQAMSYSPDTGYAYIPAQSIPITLKEDPDWAGFNSNVPGQLMSNIGWNLSYTVNEVPPESKPFGRLIAWDPVKNEEAWAYEYESPWNGGTLATKGNLVFQGTADGHLLAFNAKTGDLLWGSQTGTGAIAAPVSYQIGDTQYISIAAGWGGVYGLLMPDPDASRNAPRKVYTFSLKGQHDLPKFEKNEGRDRLTLSEPPAFNEKGMKQYMSNCVYCHGFPGQNEGGVIPNLGFSHEGTIRNLESFVFKGPFMFRGMPDFTDKLSREEVEDIKEFILSTAEKASK